MFCLEILAILNCGFIQQSQANSFNLFFSNSVLILVSFINFFFTKSNKTITNSKQSNEIKSNKRNSTFALKCSTQLFLVNTVFFQRKKRGKIFFLIFGNVLDTKTTTIKKNGNKINLFLVFLIMISPIEFFYSIFFSSLFFGF